jgi:hypothetical protein
VQKLDRLLSIATVILTITTIVGITATVHYRNLYLQNPLVKTEVKTVEGKIQQQVGLDHIKSGSSQAYRCVPQKISAEGYGMICTSPDRNTQIFCTTTGGESVEYFC